MPSINLAGRAGRWSAAHWKTAALGWIAFAVLAVVAGSAVGAKQMKSWAISNGESRRAEQILTRRRLPDARRRERARPVVDKRVATRGFRAAWWMWCAPSSGQPQVDTSWSAARAGEPGTGLAGPAFGARPVRDPRRRGQGRQEGAPILDAVARVQATASRLHGGRVRLRQPTTS